MNLNNKPRKIVMASYKVLLKVPDSSPLSLDVNAGQLEAKGNSYDFLIEGDIVASFPKSNVLAVLTEDVVLENGGLGQLG
jgi:hypothetical protein